jgi:hypothetical protein
LPIFDCRLPIGPQPTLKLSTLNASKVRKGGLPPLFALAGVPFKDQQFDWKREQATLPDLGRRA